MMTGIVVLSVDKNVMNLQTLAETKLLQSHNFSMYTELCNDWQMYVTTN